ncbi:HEAT repeat protein [Dictyocaulus viviparus]|uniref:HEAT repeat protein n=1 Tax=Dictyocaulus viviparus TaxID=29172 RepID=A0A0D8Y1B3_DICVI|nr:HEAT repeat protein [Dictyocaulus viviparus]
MLKVLVEANVEERPPPPPTNSLDWDKLFKMAEMCDLDDDIRGPVETAMANLEGSEVQKLSALRNLGELLQNEGDEAIERVLPAVQRVLLEERSNLDLHCEAAIVFKGIIKNSKLCAQFPNLINTLLQNILENITGQKDNLSAAAWLETLIEVAERVSLEAVKQYIVPIVQQQAEPSQRVQRRIIASKLLHKLADILPANEVRKELGPCAQILCQDSNANVRTSMAQRLPGLAVALKQIFFSDAKKNTVLPLIKKSTETSLENKDEALMMIAKNFGEWCFTLRDVLDQLDLCWVLNTYCKIGQISMDKDDNSTQQMVYTICRRMTAFNLPWMVQTFPKSFDRLLPFIETFAKDSDDDVRLSLASSFHEILMQNSSNPALLQPFIELIRGGSQEVVAKLTFNLDKMLPILYKCASANTGSGKVTTVQLDRIIVGCNQLLRGTGAWRSHAALLENISVLKNCITYTQLADTFIPVLQKEVLHVRALPCRLAAVNTLLQFMREQPEKKKREETIEFFKTEIASHVNCYRRQLYLDIVNLVLQLFSRKFFIHYFLDKLLTFANDKVSNIRLRTVRLLAVVKKHLILPDDEQVLLMLERAVREVLSSEKQASTRQLLQAAACELSRTEAKDKNDKEDAAREKEENRLWNESRLKQQQPPKVAGAQNSKSLKPAPNLPKVPDTRPSTWKTQRRAVAVVRPQPVVVMRSGSPIPRLNDSNRPSRLPLSSASREKEALKKAATESSLPRPSSRSSSSAVRNGMSTSTSCVETSSTPSAYPLRKSSTTSSIHGTSSSSSYSLAMSRSSTNIRRPSFGLSRVSSQSTLERKPGHMSMKVRNMEA